MLKTYSLPFRPALVAAMLFVPLSGAADTTSAPAPYRPLPPGTVLDYGRWSCNVIEGAEFETICAHQNKRARWFGRFVFLGAPDPDGYGGAIAKLDCYEGVFAGRWSPVRIDAYRLDARARQAVRGLWPLAIGKRAQLVLSTGDRSVDRLELAIHVAGSETIRAAGRERRVLRVDSEGRYDACLGEAGPTLGQLRFAQTWWYEPATGLVVRSRLRWTNGPMAGFGYDFRLARHVPPAVAVAEPPPAVSRPSADADPAPRIAAALDRIPPVIELPARLETRTGVVSVTGRVADQSRVVELSIDGRPLRPDADGSFRVRRGVPTGRSRMTVVALDEWGNRTEKVIEIVRTATTARRAAAPGSFAPADSPAVFAGLDFGRYHALVIGNNTYANLPDLDTAVNDARAVAALLERSYGFRTTLLINATRKKLIDALARYRAELQSDDSLLVYYAGHGVLDEVTRQGYWLPVDADERSPSNWVSVNDITLMLKAIRSRHVMVVADSCYSGTLVRAAPAGLRTAAERRAWVERMRGKRARTALTSGGLEPVLDSDGGAHSVFAKAFLTALNENSGVLEGGRLYDVIKRPVVLNSDQTPVYSDIRRAGHEGGDFLFVRRQ